MARPPLVAHGIRAYRQYQTQEGSTLAAAVTYFAFLSLFPLLALAFAGIGLVAHFIPDARAALQATLETMLPGMIGNGRGQISLASIQHAAGAVAGIGIITVTYSGLGWISSMRDALADMFEMASADESGGWLRTFISEGIRDAWALIVVGLVLLSSVVVSGGLVSFIDVSADWLLGGLLIVAGVASGTVLFLTMFKMLAEPERANRALWSGAVVGAVGFEVLKQASHVLLSSTAQEPAFQSFGIALILLVWIYYFSRVVMYAAAWAQTADSADEQD